MDAAENLDQGRFPGPVLAEQRNDLAPTDRKRHVAQRIGAAEMLVDPIEEQALLCWTLIHISSGVTIACSLQRYP